MRPIRVVAALLGVVAVTFGCSGAAAAATRSFPGRNGLIAYAGPYARGYPQIDVVRANGAGFRRLTPDCHGRSGLRCGGQSPSWSPDGSTVAYRKGQLNGLFFVSQRGGRPKRVDPRGLPHDADDPSWAPDGRRLVFTDSHDLFVVNVDGSGLERLRIADPPTSVNDPAWSPSGGAIVFSGRPDDGAEQVFLVKPDGTGLRQLTKSGGLQPEWSPDGSKIAILTGWGEGYVPPDSLRVTIMNADGSGARVVRKIRNPGPPISLGLAWSPDGKKIAFVEGSDTSPGSSSLWVMDARGTNAHWVTEAEGDLSWQPRR